ncbi:M56 family metallopeptidase [Hoyosella altamirensis]|uniref:Zn-dependent protease with chaperone function n=1 Tax=Hoyosella altamirensis TaxID=616997 RepID=A0A839RJY7_9ACTN|nr:M56 family metallopeptidase [Hoyosella altamirensis]MBB3036311.1 Zn-dependent protease with chaperone function [Hoyosella altamirensis]
MTGTTAALFAALAVLLAGPVPALLSRARWPLRAPRAALVLWQSIALAAVLSAFSSGLAIASMLLVPGPDGRPTTSPTDEISALGLPLWMLSVAVFALTVLIGARLLYSTARVAIKTRRRRAHHRMLVDLLDQRDPRLDGLSKADLRVLQHHEPMAYCLPGLKQRVVVSAGTLDQLEPEELNAILAHERAHLRARHDLVLEAFTAVHEAFPRFVRSKTALGSVRLLIELLADDAALRTTGPRPLAHALVTCASSKTPEGAMAAGGPSTVVRVRRLAEGTYDGRISVAAYSVAALIMVGPTIAVAVPWLVELSRLFGLAPR